VCIRDRVTTGSAKCWCVATIAGASISRRHIGVSGTCGHRKLTLSGHRTAGGLRILRHHRRCRALDAGADTVNGIRSLHVHHLSE
jgi:hypothetical protein